MSLIEYKGYRISVSALEQTWGFAFGEWSGMYRVWQQDNPEPMRGVVKGSAPSAYEAERKALQTVKGAIDGALRRSAEHLRCSLQ